MRWRASKGGKTFPQNFLLWVLGKAFLSLPCHCIGEIFYLNNGAHDSDTVINFMKHWFSFILFKTFTKSFYWWGVKILIFNYGNLFLGSYSGCRVLLPYPERESFIRTTLICGFPVEKLPQGVKVEPFPKFGWVVKFWSFEFRILNNFCKNLYFPKMCAVFYVQSRHFLPLEVRNLFIS